MSSVGNAIVMLSIPWTNRRYMSAAVHMFDSCSTVFGMSTGCNDVSREMHGACSISESRLLIHHKPPAVCGFLILLGI